MFMSQWALLLATMTQAACRALGCMVPPMNLAHFAQRPKVPWVQDPGPNWDPQISAQRHPQISAQ